MDSFLDTPDDCQWLRDVHLTKMRGVTEYPLFFSATLHGNEDCPQYIRLYGKRSPNFDDKPVLALRLFDCPIEGFIYVEDK